MKRIVITNQKGGCGKTSTSIEVATCLGKMGKRVLLIDADQQCNASMYADSIPGSKTIFDVLNGDCSVDEAIQEKKYFKLIPGSDGISRADRIFLDNDDKYLIDDVLKIIDNDYDYAIIDTAPARNIILVMSYVAADYIILPAECDEGSRVGINAIEKDLEKLKKSRDNACHAEILGYILTKYERTTMHSIAEENLKELAESKESKPFVMRVGKSVKMAEIKTLHMAINEVYPSSKPARDYYSITEEIVRRVGV